MSDKTPPPTVWPTLRANDARALIRFLVDVVGFEETAVYGEGVKTVESCTTPSCRGRSAAGSCSARRATTPTDAADDRPGQFSAYVVVDEPDALCARIQAGGAKVTVDLHDTDYGSRDFAIRDPEGNRWYFGTYRGAPRAS